MEEGPGTSGGRAEYDRRQMNSADTEIMTHSLSVSQDVLYTVCNTVCDVLRIVIFKRNGVQAMVEYPDCVNSSVCVCVKGLYMMRRVKSTWTCSSRFTQPHSKPAIALHP